jgi:hypothetical protein
MDMDDDGLREVVRRNVVVDVHPDPAAAVAAEFDAPPCTDPAGSLASIGVVVEMSADDVALLRENAGLETRVSETAECLEDADVERFVACERGTAGFVYGGFHARHGRPLLVVEGVRVTAACGQALLDRLAECDADEKEVEQDDHGRVEAVLAWWD